MGYQLITHWWRDDRRRRRGRQRRGRWRSVFVTHLIALFKNDALHRYWYGDDVITSFPSGALQLMVIAASFVQTFSMSAELVLKMVDVG